MLRKVMVTGSSGFVADYCMLELTKRAPALKILGMSRSGKARHPEVMEQYENISYMVGNCLEPETFKDSLHDIDGLIHSVGTLVEDKGNPQLTF